MSLCHSIEVQLSEALDKEHVKKFLTNGKEFGCIYYTEAFPPDTTHLDIAQAVENIFNNLSNPKEVPAVSAQFSDTFFDIIFNSTEYNQLQITLLPVYSLWKIKDADGFLKIDFARYLKIMAGLCKNFVIEEIKVESI